MPAELFSGLLVGVVGLAAAASWRSVDWGTLWTVLALGGLFLLTPRWIADFPAHLVGLAAGAGLIGAAGTGISFHRGENLVAWCFVVSLGGAWATVPDTESVSVLLGTAAPLALAAFPLRTARTSWYGGVVAGALSTLVVLTEASTRPAAVIGATGALAATALWQNRPYYWLQHLALVGFWSRVVGRESSELRALVLGLAFTVAVVGVGAGWRRLRRARPE